MTDCPQCEGRGYYEVGHDDPQGRSTPEVCDHTYHLPPVQVEIPTTKVTIELTDEQWRLVDRLWAPLADSIARGVALPPIMALKGQIAAKIHEQGEDM